MQQTTQHEFLIWYQPIHAPFVRFCANKAYGIMETEDLVQDAILATLKGFYTIKNKDRLMGFMIGVVNNIIRNRLRRQKFKGQWNEQAFAKLESRAPSPEVALDIHYLHKAIEQLPKKQQEALVLYEISGFSMKEIGEIQNSSLSATKTRVSRARQALKNILNEEGKNISLTQRLAIYASIML